MRCIRPNTNQHSDIFNENLVLSQLVSSCSTAYQQLMRIGFPSHMDINDFLNTFEQHLEYCKAISNNRKDICSELLRSCGLRWKDFKIGNTKIFFRIGKRDVITEKLKGDLEQIVKHRRKLKFLRTKLRFAIIAIATRCCSIRKTLPIQDNSVLDSVVLAVNAAELDNLSNEEPRPENSRKRKLDKKSDAICEIKSRRHELLSTRIESKFMHIYF